MEIIKKQYTKPRPILYLYRGMPETSLVSNDFNTATDLTLNQQINEVATLEFQIPFTQERKLSVDDCEKLVKFEGEYYIIKTIDTEDSTSATMKVSCQHESSELKGVYCTAIDLAGAYPEQMFNKIMGSTMHPVNTGYKWAGTDVDSSKRRHLITDNEQSVYENLVDMAEVFNGWLEFYTDSNEQKWIFLRTKSINSNKWIKKGLDMKSLNITYSSEEIFTRLYPLGASNSITGEELNIIGVNPTGKSYVENYSYYIAKGIPTSVIDKEAKYQQLKMMTASDYTDAKELYDFAVEELEKCCYPQLDATLTISDLSVYVDSLDIPPMIGYDIKCVDKDINFILDCMITGVERNYDNPVDTRITISNLVRYDTFFQKLEHSANETDKMSSTLTDVKDSLITNIENLNATNIDVQNLFANKANIVDLNATNAHIDNLDVTVGKIETLVNGNLTSNNIHSLILTSDKVTVENGFIKNAMIESLDVSKINAGTISTNKFTISSNDGGISIVGATQQFKDKNNKVRIQMGRDTSGKFTFILRGEDGTSTLIDENGVHEKAISDGLIKENMVAENAIGEKQINYNSFVTGFNKDTNTQFIKASKVNIDLTGQRLDVAFNTMNTKIDGIKTTTESNTTSINAMQGQITTLISNTTIIKDGKTTQLKDAYNGTVQTVNSLSTTIGEHTSTLNSLNGTVTSNSSKITNIQSDLNGVKTTVSDTKTTLENKADTSTVTAISNRTSSLETSVTGINASIKTLNSNVSSVTTTANSAKNAIDNLQVGGRNLVLNSAPKTNNWSWAGASGTMNLIDEITAPYGKAMKATFTTTSTSSGGMHKPPKTRLTVGQVYSWSMWIKASKNMTILIGHEQGGNKNFNVTTSWQKLTHTFTANNSSFQSFVMYVQSNINTGDYYLVHSLKVEEGNKPTDWTPAPEETDSQITSINSSVSSMESSISVLQKQIVLKVEQSDINSAVTKLDGKIQSTNTTVSNMQSSITALQKQIVLKVEQSDINSAVTTLDGKIQSTNTTVSNMQSSITALQKQIVLKVEQSDINSAVTTLDGKIQSTNTTINNMQSSIDLRLNSITSKVNQSVSSRNLINNSALKNSLGHYYASNGGATHTRIVNKSEFNGWNYVSPPVCDNAIHIRYDKPGDNYVEFFDLLAKVKPNTKYTISYYYSIDSPAGSSNLSASSSFIYYRKADGSGLPDPNFAIDINFSEYTGRNRWVRYVKTFTTPNVYELDNLILRFGFWQSNSNFLEMLVTGIQLEEGDLTEWTEGIYSSVGTIITQSPTQVAIAIQNKTNSQAIFDSNGLTIENGKLKINKNGQVNLYIDPKGYLNSQSGLRVMDKDREGQPEIFLSEMGVYMEYYYRNGNVLKDTRLTPEKNGIRCDRGFFVDGDMDIENDLWVGGDLQVEGKKHCLVNTDNYGKRLINAYETAEYYFGDIGRAILDNNGECIVYIDDIFGECVNTQIQYEVFTSVYNGKLDEDEPIIMNDNYFIFKGKPNSLIGWEIKAKRKGWENVRLEEKLDYDDFVEELNEINFMDDKTVIDKVEDILFDEEV